MTVTLDLPPQIEEAYEAEARARGLSLDDVVREILIAGRPKTVPAGTPEDAESLRRQYAVLREAIASEEHGFLDAKAIEAEIAERKGFRG